MPEIFGQNRKPGALDQSLSQGYSLDRFAIDMALRMRTILQYKRMTNIALIAGDVLSNSGVLAEQARIRYDFDAGGFEVDASAVLFGITAFVNNGTYQVRLFNLTDAAVLATISVNVLVPTVFTQAFTFPTAGVKEVVVDIIRTAGTPADIITVRNAWMEWTSTP